MPPTPDIYTDRYYVDYEGDHGKHTMMLRLAPGTALATAMAKVLAVVNVFKAISYQATKFNQVRFSAAGSNVSFPVAWTIQEGAIQSAHAGVDHPRFISFVGRDSGNVKTRIFLIGCTTAADTDYRVDQGSVTVIDAILAELRSTTTPLLAVSGLVPFWNSYANTGWHAYHQRKRRRIA